MLFQPMHSALYDGAAQRTMQGALYDGAVRRPMQIASYDGELENNALCFVHVASENNAKCLV